MHQLGCARNNFCCPQCGVVVPVKEKNKHAAVAHAVLDCRCGQRVEWTALPVHQPQCAARLVPCRFCPLSVEFIRMFQHAETCRLRSVVCAHCQVAMRAQEARYHCSQQHGIATEACAVGKDFV